MWPSKRTASRIPDPAPCIRSPLLLLVLLLSFSACVTDERAVRVEKGPAAVQKALSRTELARFCDTFDKFREDLWTTSGYIPREELRGKNFKMADVRVKDGQLRMETKTGCFSGGGVGSNFGLQGDFDIQVDCRLEFLKDAADMEQVVMVNVVDTTKELSDSEMESVSIGLFKSRRQPSRVQTFYRETGRIRELKTRPCGDFHGAFRVVRRGKTVETMFRDGGETGWKSLGRYTWPASEAAVSLKVQNFGVNREAIGVASALSILFDNFVINSADRIVESEI